jgi:hypothetical protein
MTASYALQPGETGSVTLDPSTQKPRLAVVLGTAASLQGSRQYGMVNLQ